VNILIKGESMGGFSMEKSTKRTFRAWIQAIGTVTAAVGSTPSLNEDTQESMNLWVMSFRALGMH
jgi:hypothetical protein